MKFSLSASDIRQNIGVAAFATACGLGAIPAWASDAVIASNFNGSQIVVSASTDRFAGAIDSITYNNVQYINISDHGRELQTAVTVDNLGECYNPTEAGSLDDGTGPTSTSILQSIGNASNVLTTQTNMANWLKPGENDASAGCSGQNPTVVSNFILNKTVSWYGAAIPNLFIDNVSITAPSSHATTRTEAATAYMPKSFSTFLSYDRASRTLSPLTATPSAPSALYIPVIVSTANGTSSMGVISPSTYNGAANRPYYLYFAFGGASASSKWTCVFNDGPINPGTPINYTCAVAIGSVDEVIAAMNAYPSQPITQNIPIFRFSGYGHHFFTLSYNEGASATYSFETTAFHLFPANAGSGYYPLYRCYYAAEADVFISAQSNCEGFSQEGIYGYAAPNAAPGLYPLYRFFRGGKTADHLETINYSEGSNNGYTYEGILGYVAP